MSGRRQQGFRRLTIIRLEDDEGVFKLPNLLQVANNFAHVLVHVVDHAGKALHGSGRRFLLVGIHILPSLDRLRCDHLMRRDVLVHNPEFLKGLESLQPERIWAIVVHTLVALPVLTATLEGPVRSRKWQVCKERLLLVLGRPLVEVFDEIVGVKIGREKAFRVLVHVGLNLDSLAVFAIQRRDPGEEVDVIFTKLRLVSVVIRAPGKQGKRAIKASLGWIVLWQKTEVPFSAE